MTTAIIGVGTMGSQLARRLAAGGEPLVLAARDRSGAEALAAELGPSARAASVDDAIAGADTVILALWLDALREFVPQKASLMENKVVIDPSNPVGFDQSGKPSRTLPDGVSSGSVVAALLPASAHYVKAFGTFGAADFVSGADREPRRAVLFYATDDDTAAPTVERLIRVAGYEPVKAGGVADALRIEFFGDLNSKVFDVDEARAAVTAKVSA
jgi:predicted dinucleotide-binding enzyme